MRTIKIFLICMVLMLVISLIVGGCAQPAPAPKPTPTPAPVPTPPPVTKINLRFSSQWPEQSPMHKVLFKTVLDEIEQQSNGRITFTLYAGGVLGGGPEQYDIVATGKADMGTTTPGYTPGRFPLTDVLTFPGAYETSNAGQEAAQAIFDRLIYKEYTDTRVLAMDQSQRFHVYTSQKPLKTLDDIKGLKIRSAGGIITPSLQALGAAPIFMSLPEAYLALQTGVVDGALFGPSAGPSFKMQEVLKYALKFKAGYATSIIMVNLDSWKKIPDDLKPIMEKAARKFGFGEVSLFNQDDPVMTKALEGRGGSSYVLPPDEETRWINALKPVINKWVEDMEAKGLPAKQLLNIAREECQKKNIPFPY